MFAQVRNRKLQHPNQKLVKFAITISSASGFGINVDRLMLADHPQNLQKMPCFFKIGS